jgi:hypothetical protein
MFHVCSQVYQYQAGNDNTMTPKFKKDPGNDFFNQSPAPGKLNKLFAEEEVKQEDNGNTNGHVETTGTSLTSVRLLPKFLLNTSSFFLSCDSEANILYLHGEICTMSKSYFTP